MYSRENFGKVEDDLEKVESSISGKMTVNELLDLVSEKERLENARTVLIGEAYDMAKAEDAEINAERARIKAEKDRTISPEASKNKFNEMIKDITAEVVDEIYKEIRRLSLSQNITSPRLVLKDDEERLKRIVPSLLDKIKHAEGKELSEEEAHGILALYHNLLSLRTEKNLIRMFDELPEDFILSSQLEGIESISFIKPSGPDSNSINIVINLSHDENGTGGHVTLTLNKDGKLYFPGSGGGWPTQLERVGVSKEVLREEIFGNLLHKLSLHKVIGINIPFGAQDIGPGRDEVEPRGPGENRRKEERTEYYVSQRDVVVYASSTLGYNAYVLKNGIIFDNPIKGNAIYTFEFTEPLSDIEMSGLRLQRYSKEEMWAILEKKGYRKDAEELKTRGMKKSEGRFFANHPNHENRDQNEAFYGQNGKLQKLINQMAA